MQRPDRQKKFIVMCGLPGAGKTTFVNDYFSYEPHYVRVCSTDSIVEHYARLNDVTYDAIFNACIKKASKQFWEDVEVGIGHFDTVIIDQTNLTRLKREKLLKMVPEGWRTECWHFVCNDAELDRRLTERAKKGKTIPPHVMSDMKERYQPPEKDEGFDCVITVYKEKLGDEVVFK